MFLEPKVRTGRIVDMFLTAFFMDPDSAYYVRISKEIAERGQYGTADPETGQLIDTLQYAPDEIKNSRKSRTRRNLAGWRCARRSGS